MTKGKTLEHKISIEGIGEFRFSPEEIVSARGDIFQDGHFSVFDILWHLNETGRITMDARFDWLMDTWVIENINGIGGWWYTAKYSSGAPSQPRVRMDYYPYTKGVKIGIVKGAAMHEGYVAEGESFADNGGAVIIPRVSIDAPSAHIDMEDVKVIPHNRRSDVFKCGIVTALDTILTLQDMEIIKPAIRESGKAPDKAHYVSGINNDLANSLGGFVYEQGIVASQGSRTDLSADLMVLHSPEYVAWKWVERH